MFVFSVALTPITNFCQHVHWVDITERRRRPAVGLGREKKSHLVLPGTLYINMHTLLELDWTKCKQAPSTVIAQILTNVSTY